jgi:hypothetical protein
MEGDLGKIVSKGKQDIALSTFLTELYIFFGSSLGWVCFSLLSDCSLDPLYSLTPSFTHSSASIPTSTSYLSAILARPRSASARICAVSS